MNAGARPSNWVVPAVAMAKTRWIVLGASNAARGGLALLDAMRARAGGPVDVHAALGRGRSYGLASRLFGRGLGSIAKSAVWSATAPSDRERTRALLMDVGNDLFYGVAAVEVLTWVELCLQQLSPRAAEVAVVGIPLERLHRLRPWQFDLYRRVVVPSCRLAYDEGLLQAQELQAGLAALADRFAARFVPVEDAWYGLDPIHVRRGSWPSAAAQLVDAGPRQPPVPRLDGSVARLNWFMAAPHERTWWGRPQRRVQPARRFADGSTWSLW
jgi:hypothetical protein